MLVEIILSGSLPLLGLGLLFHYHRRRIQQAHLLTQAEKDIVIKQVTLLFAVMIASGVLVIGLLLIGITTGLSLTLIQLFIGVWVSFALGCLTVFSYIGISAIRNRVAFIGTQPVKGRQAVVAGGIWLVTVVMGLALMPLAIYTIWRNQALIQMVLNNLP